MEKIAKREAGLEARRTRARNIIIPPINQIPESNPKEKRTGNRLETPIDTENESMAALKNRIKKDLEIITMIATKSSNLKGEYVKNLKEAVKSIGSAIGIAINRSSRSCRSREGE